VLRGRKFKSKTTAEAKNRLAREAVETFLDSERDIGRRAPRGVIDELAAARRLRRIDPVLASLMEAGVKAELSSDQRTLIVQGTPVLLPRPGARWQHDRLVEDIANDALAEYLLGQVRDNLTGLPLRAVPTPDGVVLISRIRVVARVRATRAVLSSPSPTTRTPQPVGGNFLAPGRHWKKLLAALRWMLPPPSLGTPSPASPTRVQHRIIADLGDEISAELRELAVIASQLIRDERTVAFGHAVELHMPGERVRFEPIRKEGAALEVPFVYHAQGGELRAAIRLRSAKDPMVIALEHTDADDLVGRGWVTALVAFADLTCIPQSDHPPEQSERRRHSPSNISAKTPRTRAVRHGKTTLAASLTPSHATAHLLAS
jgi:hypothetical protein